MASENPVILVLDKDAESYMSISKLFGQRVELARCDGIADAGRAADGREPFLSIADGDSADGLNVASRLKAKVGGPVVVLSSHPGSPRVVEHLFGANAADFYLLRPIGGWRSSRSRKGLRPINGRPMCWPRRSSSLPGLK